MLGGFASANHIAGYAGLAPAPRDSGSRSGNLQRRKRYNRQLQRVFNTSALISIQKSPASLVVFLIFQKYFIQSVAGSAVKG
ncbi:MAG: transposase [Propionicimonas sp.]